MRTSLPWLIGFYVINADGTHASELDYGHRPVWSPQDSNIMYISGVDGHIFVTDVDGIDRRQITSNGGIERVDWSPDGSRVAYIRSAQSDSGAADVYVMNIDGTDEQKLTDHGQIDYLEWSPDGSQILYGTIYRTGPADGTYVMNANGTNHRQLTYATPESYRASWSPDSAGIVYFGDVSDVVFGNPGFHIVYAMDI